MTAGLLMVGALFSNANAAIETTALTVVDGDGFKDGKSYYVVMTGSDATLADGSIVLGMKNTDGTLSATNVVMTGADAASKEHIWKVTKAIVEGKVEYTLYNAEAGAYLAFATAKIEAKEGTNAEIAIGTIVTSKKLADGKAADVDFTFALPSNEAYSGGGQLFASSADAGTDETFLKLAANATTLEATGNYKIVLCELAEKELDADALNAPLAGKGFSFDFPLADGEPALEGNVFAQPLKAFTFANTTAAPVTGTYFAVSYPADGKIETANEFAGSTFIALDPINNYGFTGVDAKEGLGYKFKTVAGKVLKASPDIKKGDIPAENAMFTVTEEHPSNAAGQFSISMSDVKVKDGDDFSATKDVFVAVVKSMNKNYLTTNKEASAAKFATSDMVTAKDLLKASAPAVYQIMFTSNKATVEDATSSEYGKYLHVTSDGSDFSLQADGSSFVMLNTPNAQWTIAAVDADNMFTFRNRETDKEVSMVLYKTGEGDYLVKDAKDAPTFEYGYLTTGGAYTVTTGSSDNLKGTTIKLVEVKNITPTAGFVNLTNEQLEGLTKIQFTKPDDITADNLFVTVASNKDVKVNKDETEAALWEVVKFDASAADKSMAISDTIYNVNGFVYWDATKKEVKEKAEGDTIAVISYAFKLFTNDAKNWYLNAAGAKAEEVKEAEEPAKFVLKLNNNGSYSLIKADADFTTMVAATATVFSVSGTTKALVNSMW